MAADGPEGGDAQDGWYLVLMIWGERYVDEACNRLVRGTLAASERCAGIIVLTDRLDRRIDPRARQRKSTGNPGLFTS